MKKLWAVLFVFVVVAAIGSSVCMAQQLPAPKTEAVFPGITTILYADETFVFTTTVKLSARFEWIGGNQIRILVRTTTTPREGMQLAPGQALRIYWEDEDEVLYDGTPPTEWSGIVLTEGGFTEK